MKTTDVDLKPLHAAIRNRGMMELWADGLFIESEEEGWALAERKKKAAEKAYIRMMESPRSKDTISYQQWALSKTLGIETRGTKAGHSSKVHRLRN